MKTRQHHYHAIIEDVNDAIYTTDLQGNFTSINPAGVRMTGYTKKEFQKLYISKIVAPDDMALVRNMIQKKVSKDISTVYEINIIKKDRNRIPVEISSRALYEDGVAVGIIGIARDITERKSLEQQKDIFFSLITHEIKNPLSSIKAFAELLRRYHGKTEEEKPKHYAVMIDEQVDKLTALVNDFLDLSKMNAGKFTLKKQKFEIEELIARVVNTFNMGQAENRITKKGKGKKYVYGDAQRIEQVLSNLLTNAIKYSPKGSAIIVETQKNRKQTTVNVIDHGMGIPEEYHGDVFELFFRMQQHQKSEITGHGLGLYVCKQIILGHKGKIWVTSNNGQGTTFSFSLPNFQRHYNKTAVVHGATPVEAKLAAFLFMLFTMWEDKMIVYPFV